MRSEKVFSVVGAQRRESSSFLRVESLPGSERGILAVIAASLLWLLTSLTSTLEGPLHLDRTCLP